MLEAGASNVLEPGFAQLLDMVPPPLAAHQNPRDLVGSGVVGSEEKRDAIGVRRAEISRCEELLSCGELVRLSLVFVVVLVADRRPEMCAFGFLCSTEVGGGVLLCFFHRAIAVGTATDTDTRLLPAPRKSI